MINHEQLAICRRLGHVAQVTGLDWTQCEVCGMWIRERRTIEESEINPRRFAVSEVIPDMRGVSPTEILWVEP